MLILASSIIFFLQSLVFSPRHYWTPRENPINNVKENITKTGVEMVVVVIAKPTHKR